MEDMYKEIYETLKKEIENNRRWKDLPNSWKDRINHITMTVLLKVVYNFKVIPTKIPMTCFTERENSIIKLIWRYKPSELVKISCRKGNSGSITILTLNYSTGS
jgi:hypothetical protein